MTDNSNIPWLGQTYAADDINNVYYQRIKLALGDDGVNDGDVSSSNPIPTASQLTDNNNDNNSTSIALSAGETFTGQWTLATKTHLMFMSKADSEGTLYLDFREPDATGSDPAISTYPIAGYACSANIPEVHAAILGYRQFRVRYVNGSTAQTSFTLTCSQLNLGTPLMAALNQSISLDQDATVVRPTNHQDEVSIGRYSGVSQFNKFAHRPDLDTVDGSAWIIADSTTNDITLLTSPETFTVTYNNITDGAGTTGAINLYFFYIDANGELAIGVHVLGSTGSDVTSFTGYGINRVVLGNSGSNDSNGSDITITHTTNGGVAAFIPAGESTTQQAAFFTPINSKAVAKSLLVNITKLSGGSSPRVTIKGWVWNRPIATKYEIFRYVIDTSTENTLTFTDACNFPLTEGDVIWFEAQTDTNNTTIGSLRFSVNVYQNQ